MDVMEILADVLIIGGGIGGTAAALAATRTGATVVMTEPSSWIGGQLTSQAVPPDEYPWVERLGGSESYRTFRRNVRRFYRSHYPLSPLGRRQRHLNPGSSWASGIAHEPRVALAVLEAMLQPARASGQLRVLHQSSLIGAEVAGDTIRWAEFERTGGERFIVAASRVIDASETGDLLPLAGIEHVTGSEAQSVTDEPHAAPEARPLNIQALTYCVAVDHVPGADHTIERPDTYDTWRACRPEIWPDRLLSWTGINPRTLEPVTYPFLPDATETYDDRSHLMGVAPGGKDLWSYRRILAKQYFEPGFLVGDATIINWPQNDYTGGPAYGVAPDIAAANLEEARELSRSLLYWLQTEAPRPDGGCGWPSIRPRGDMVGTDDGLAMMPYHRESRRIDAVTTIVEHDVSQAVRGTHGATRYDDTVGTGYCRLDLHPTTGGDTFLDLPTAPFELPLGALLPVRVENVIAGAKNIGTTHITNGCYRGHPTEWLIGEVAGYLAAWSLRHDIPPRAVRSDARRREPFQGHLAGEGIMLHWPEHIHAPRG
jgi:hypothetical protein